MLHVFAIITTKPGSRDAVLEAFRANMPSARAEEGCIEYVPMIDFAEFGPFQKELGADTFVVVEKWASPEALNAHAAAPHMKAFAEKTRPDRKAYHPRPLARIARAQHRRAAQRLRGAPAFGAVFVSGTRPAFRG